MWVKSFRSCGCYKRMPLQARRVLRFSHNAKSIPKRLTVYIYILYIRQFLQPLVRNIGSQTDLLADFRSLHQPVFQKRYLINCLTGEGSYSCQVNGAKRNHRPSLISYDMPVRRRLPFQALPCTHISKDSGL